MQHGAGICKKTSLGSKAITYRARVLPDPQATLRAKIIIRIYPQHIPSPTTGRARGLLHSACQDTAAVHWQTPLEPELGLVLFSSRFLTL